eukprot:GHVS01058723.1.p1 GENE.GHVS01058723.1~~GHVS01058723.1.p1  ORF type:complete len:663 (+),score=167.68 GHVS01058723.1:51-2039(+)
MLSAGSLVARITTRSSCGGSCNGWCTRQKSLVLFSWHKRNSPCLSSCLVCPCAAVGQCSSSFLSVRLPSLFFSSSARDDTGLFGDNSSNRVDEVEAGPEPAYGIAKGYDTFVYSNTDKPFTTTAYWWHERQRTTNTSNVMTTDFTSSASSSSSSGGSTSGTYSSTGSSSGSSSSSSSSSGSGSSSSSSSSISGSGSSISGSSTSCSGANLSIGVLPELRVAFECWGQLNSAKDNVLLLMGGLSSSSHAKSHPNNPDTGWWEDFIGPGQALDTNHFYIICTNNLGGCYGSSGPSTINPITNTNYALSFPFFTVQDMVHAQFLLLDSLGISKLYAVVGSSLGGMQSLAAAALYPQRVGRMISISAAALSHPQSIALRYSQRRALMADPNFNGGNYYQSTYPTTGMTLAREIATVTYRSGPEWEQRFGRKRSQHMNRTLKAPGVYVQQHAEEGGGQADGGGREGVGVVEEDYWCPPTLRPDFLIETYLEHQGLKFCHQYDPNSLILISKAMDLFTIAHPSPLPPCSISSPFNAFTPAAHSVPLPPPFVPPIAFDERSGKQDMREFGRAGEMTCGLLRGIQHVQMPCLIMGAQSDRLFPIWQQKQIADMLRAVGNNCVTYYELDALYGHDTFLLDVVNVGAAVKGHLEQRKKWCGGGVGMLGGGKH